MDVDLLVRLPSAAVGCLVEALGPDWYADPDAMREALASDRPFNVIHGASGEESDFFPAVAEFYNEELRRSNVMDIDLGGNVLRLPVASLEDIIWAKLQWHRAPGEVSERQWSSVENLRTVNHGVPRQVGTEARRR